MSNYNPMSKKFQEDAKRLGLTGYQLLQKYINEGKLKVSIPSKEDNSNRRKKFLEEMGFKNNSEYLEYLAKNKGFKSRNEQRRKIYEDDLENNRIKNREWHYKNKDSSPMSENAKCSSFTGVFLGEKIIGKTILLEIFGSIEKEMTYGNSGYEFVVKGGYKIEIKTGKLLSDDRWIFDIKLNKIADYFLMIGLDSTKSKIIHIWLFKKDDVIKKRIDRYEVFKVNKIEHLSISNNTERLQELRDYEMTDKLVCIKEINDKLGEIE